MEEPWPQAKSKYDEVSPGSKVRKSERGGESLAGMVASLWNVSCRASSYDELALLIRLVDQLEVVRSSYPCMERLNKRGSLAEERGKGVLEVRAGPQLHVMTELERGHIYLTGRDDYMYFSDTGSDKGSLKVDGIFDVSFHMYEVQPHSRYTVTLQNVAPQESVQKAASVLGCTELFFQLIVGALSLEDCRFLAWADPSKLKMDLTGMDAWQLQMFPGTIVPVVDATFDAISRKQEADMLHSLLKHTYGVKLDDDDDEEDGNDCKL